LTIENEIVYDPFLGQGTFGMSAVKKKRQFIGAEIDSEHFQTAQRLLCIAGETNDE
jgi:site-specific DNA-methyltransferase (adenine-specific)